MSTEIQSIQCSGCGRSFPWKVQFAGRQAKCPCGSVMVYPAAPAAVEASNPDDPFAEDRGEYDLTPAQPVRTSVVAVAPSQVAASPALVVAADGANTRTLNYRSATVRNEGELDTEKLTQQTVPLCLLAGGLVVESGFAVLHGRNDALAATIHLLLSVGVGTVLMMIGVLIAAHARGVKIGSLGTALLRLAALSIAPMAAGDLITPVAGFIPLVGGLLVLVAEFLIYFALLGMFFDLDESDTWYFIGIIFLVNVAVYFMMRFS